jgi:hypothetical protein
LQWQGVKNHWMGLKIVRSEPIVDWMQSGLVEIYEDEKLFGACGEHGVRAVKDIAFLDNKICANLRLSCPKVIAGPNHDPDVCIDKTFLMHSRGELNLANHWTEKSTTYLLPRPI